MRNFDVFLVIIGQPKGCPPPELKLTLSSLQAPRLALKPATMSSTLVTTKDQEPFAWESREFLRKLCIGKQVFFKVEYTVQSIGRHFGSVYLLEKSESDLFVGPSSHKMTENICLIMAREGWCSVRTRSKDNDSEKCNDIEEMIELNEQAKRNKVGIYNTAKAQDSIRTVKWDFISSKETSGETDVMKLYTKIKDIPQRAIVEYIRDGSSLKALLLDSMTLITFNMAGIQSPRMNMSAKILEDGSNPYEYAQEAKFFTEVRLLNREVILKVGGVNEKYATFFGSVTHPKNKLNIAVELVRNGIAQPVDWSMSFTTPAAATSIHQALLFAKKNRIRLWKEYRPPLIPGDKKFSGVVSEIVSGDSFLVRVGTDEDLTQHPWLCEERKIHLSSIRAPRLSRKDVDEPFARETREFLRKRLIGRKVDISIEYAIGGENQSNTQIRKYGTLFVAGSNPVNVAVLLLENGLASLMGHKQGAERSHHYHELIAAENKAQEKKIGIWGKNTESNGSSKDSKQPLDLNNAAIAKSNLGSLKGDNFDKRILGVVEYVFNGGRMKIFVPSLSLKLMMNLSGISCARTGKQKSKTETNLFADEALAYTKALCLQQDVEFVVESVDKGGNFIGTVYVRPIDNDASVSFARRRPHQFKDNLSILLLRNGFAKTNPIGIRYASNAESLLAEEEEAKMNKTGLWLHFIEEKRVETKQEEEKMVKSGNSPSKELDKIEFNVCHITSANKFFIHVTKEKEQLKKVEEFLTSYAESNGTKESEIPSTEYSKNEKVLALFDDGSKLKWYRAQITGIQKDDNEVLFTIQYLDYGNTETLTAKRLNKLTDEGIQKLPPFAHHCSLAFLKAPTLSKEFGREAAMYLSQLTRGKEMTGLLHTKEKTGALIVTLLPENSNKDEENSEEAELVTINGLLLKEGLATIPRKQRLYVKGSSAAHEKKIFSHLKEQQEAAHNSHVNLWTYGDPRDDEE